MNAEGEQTGKLADEREFDLADGPLAEPAPHHRTTWDDWTLSAEIHRARRQLCNTMAGGSSAQPWRLDEHHALGLGSIEAPEVSRVDPRSRTGRGIQSFWRSLWLTALLIGVLAFGYGGLMTSSLFNDPADIGYLGLSLMLVSLFGLLLGVLLQLFGLRHDSRMALARLRLVELRLQEYRQAALLVGHDDGAIKTAAASSPRPLRI